MRRLALFLLAAATPGCATAYRGPVVQTYRLNAPEVCATVERDQGDVPHAHLGFLARVERGQEPGDVLQATIVGAPSPIRFALAGRPGEPIQITFPAGLGFHEVRWRLERADGRIVWDGLDRDEVMDCDGITTRIRPATTDPRDVPQVHP